MKAAPPAIGFKAENAPPPLRARGRPTGYPSKNINPLPTAGERPRQGPRGSAAVLISGMKNPGLSGNLMYTKGCISFRRFSAQVKLSRHQRECPSKFRACNSITTKILRRKSGTSTLAILGRAETWGVPLSSLESFPSPMPL